MTLKVAIVGCGKIADAHVESVLALPGMARVVAACDLEILLAERLAARYAIPRHYDHLETMLTDARPDVVHITTPPRAHFAIAMQAFEAGCHVYVEKPITTNEADAKQLIDRAQATGRKLTIGLSSHFDPVACEMRALIANGALGTPLHVESFFGYSLSGPFGSVTLGDPKHWVHDLPGKLLQNNLDHVLSKVLEFVDDASPQVHVAAYRRRTEKFSDRRDDLLDELRVLLAGERTSAYCTFSSHIKPVNHFARIYGTENTMHVDYVARSIIFERAPVELGVLGRAVLPFAQTSQQLRAGFRNLGRFARSQFHYFAGMRHLLVLFYDSIVRDTPPPIAYRDILRIAAITDEIIRRLAPAGAR